MTNRLIEALALLGYENAKQLHFRSNLISAIEVFAALHGDKELESACEKEIADIRAEVAALSTNGRELPKGSIS